MAEVRFYVEGEFIFIRPKDFNLKSLDNEAVFIKYLKDRAKWRSDDLPRLVRIIKYHNAQVNEDNTYLGIGIDSSRRSKGPITTDSHIKQAWRFDVAEELFGTDLVEVVSLVHWPLLRSMRTQFISTYRIT